MRIMESVTNRFDDGVFRHEIDLFTVQLRVQRINGRYDIASNILNKHLKNHIIWLHVGVSC